jgi:hypothetical protein
VALSITRCSCSHAGFVRAIPHITAGSAADHNRTDHPQTLLLNHDGLCHVARSNRSSIFPAGPPPDDSTASSVRDAEKLAERVNIYPIYNNIFPILRNAPSTFRPSDTEIVGEPRFRPRQSAQKRKSPDWGISVDATPTHCGLHQRSTFSALSHLFVLAVIHHFVKARNKQILERLLLYLG